MIQEEEVISIGRISRLHGTQGEVQCIIKNDYWYEADATFLILRLQNILTPFRVIDWREKGGDSLLFRLDGIDDERSAQPLVNAEVSMLRRDIASVEEGLPTWCSLAGYHIVDIDQGDLGYVEEVDESTINTLLYLRDGRILSIHEDFIISLEADKQELVIRLPYLLD